MKLTRLIFTLLTLAGLGFGLHADAVTRTGQNSVKIPAINGVRNSCPECTVIINPPPDSDITVCSSGCDYLNTTAGISSAIAAVPVDGIIELRDVSAGVAEVWASRIIIGNTDGTSGHEKTIRVRDGDTVTLSTTTSNFDGLLDIQGADYWIIEGCPSTGSGTNYLTNCLRIGDRSRWTTTCNGLACMNNRRGLNAYNSTHLTFKNISFTGGNNSHANLIDGASDLIYFKNFVFDLHGTNNTGTGNDQGDLTRFYSDHTIFEDGTFSHGGHDTTGARGPHQIFRRIVFNGDWTDKFPGSQYTGNHAARFNGGQAKDESNGLYALQTAYGPFLIEDSVFTGAGLEPEHFSGSWNQVTEFWGLGGIMRGTYTYGNHAVSGGALAFFTQCSPSNSGGGSALAQYMDGHSQVYQNTTYGVLPHTGGGNEWVLATADPRVCEKMNVFNNIFMGVPTGPITASSSSKQFAWAERRAKVPLGAYTNGWKGSRIMGNIFGGPSTAMQFSLTASGGTVGNPVSVTDCSRWSSNVCNNLFTNLTFTNGSTTPTNSKAGLTLSTSNGVGLGDARAITTVVSTADTTHAVLTDAYPFKDNWGISYTFGGNHTEYGDCFAASPASGGAIGTAVSARITSINYATGAIVFTPALTIVAGSNIWKATDNLDGTCGPTWKNRGANQTAGQLIADGSTYTITGSGWGTNTATVTSLKNTIEAATAGTAVYNIGSLSATWINADGIESASHQTEVSTTQPFYGTKSLKAQGTGTQGLFGIALDTGGTISDIFIRDYIRLDSPPANQTGQWKWIRFNSNGHVTDGSPGDAYLSDWFPDNDFFSVTVTGYQHSPDPCSPSCSGSWGTATGIWYERQIRYKPSTTTGGTDGVLTVEIRRTTDFALVGSWTHSDVNSYNDASRDRYVVFYNYQGNGFQDGTGKGNSVVYMDGTWISNGSQKRVYLCDTSTWAACTKREIEDWTSWADGLIKFTIRRGWLATLNPAYVYVIDGNGTPYSTTGQLLQ